MMKQYESYLTKLFLKNILIIIIVFIFLSFFLNIFEEIKYFENKENELYYPIILTILNIPSIIFEILPFIFLLGVMFFFINLYENEEIELLRSNGVNNLKITFIISVVSFIPLLDLKFSFLNNMSSIIEKYYQLKDYSLITVKGESAHEFIQGQVSCDISSQHEKIDGLFCDEKGYVITNATLFLDEEIKILIKDDVAVILENELLKYSKFYKCFIDWR